MSELILTIEKSKIKDAHIFSEQEMLVSSFVHNQSKSQHIELINDKNVAHLSILEKASGKLIGHIILTGVNGHEIEFKRIVIYKQSVGYGTTSIELLFEYIKENHPTSKTIWLDVYHHNLKAIKLYENFGFEFLKREGDLLYYRFILNKSSSS